MRSLLLISTSYPEASADGSEAAGSFVADFAEELARRVRVAVLAPGRTEGEASSGNLSVTRFRGPGRPLSLLKPSRPADWGAIVATLRRGGAAAEALARKDGFAHTLALWALPSGYWARRIKRRIGVPYSVWALGSDIWALRRIPLVRGVLRSVLRESEACFADGLALGRDVERLSGRACAFLPSTRRLAPLAGKALSAAPPYRIAFLGRWHPNKGVDVLLDALKRLGPEQWSRIEAVKIHGGGPLEARVRAAEQTLRAQGRPVSVGGYLGKAEAATLLGWADFLAIPSRVESIPVVFSDAMQSACPVICTPAGDLPQLLQRYGVGVVASGFGDEAYARALARALADGPRRYETGLAAAARAFDLGRCVDDVLAQVR